jgi:methyl-accepting chemotaxis protein
MSHEPPPTIHARPPFWRRKRLIKPSLQLKLIVTFAALFASVFLLQTLLMHWQLAELGVDRQATVPSEVVSVIVGRMQWLAFLVCLPLTLIVGVAVTFRWAGPIYRFEQHLAAIARGENVGPCRIRKGDELHDLCTRINEAVDALRAGQRDARASGDKASAREQAA